MTEQCPLCGVEIVRVDPGVFVHDDDELTPVCVDLAQTVPVGTGA